MQARAQGEQLRPQATVRAEFAPGRTATLPQSNRVASRSMSASWRPRSSVAALPQSNVPDGESDPAGAWESRQPALMMRRVPVPTKRTAARKRMLAAVSRQRLALAIDRVPLAGLIVLFAYTDLVIAGFTVAAAYPGLLAAAPWTAMFHGASFGSLAQVQIWIGWLLLAGVLTRQAGMRWLPTFGVLFAIGFIGEVIVSESGIPFGRYHYTAALGTRWFGVPVVIPLSWYCLAIPSFAIACRVAPDRVLLRVLTGSLILLACYIALESAMSRATLHWTWPAGEPFSTPSLNLLGWYMIGLLLLATLTALRAEAWIARLPARWPEAFYAINLLLPIGMCAATRQWGAVAATLTAIGGAAIIARAVASGAPARAMVAQGVQ